MLCGLALSPWRKTRSRPARSTTATEVLVPHSASAASAIVKAMRSDTSRCIKTWALAAVGTTIITPTAAAAAKRDDMTFLPDCEINPTCGHGLRIAQSARRGHHSYPEMTDAPNFLAARDLDQRCDHAALHAVRRRLLA